MKCFNIMRTFNICNIVKVRNHQRRATEIQVMAIVACMKHVKIRPIHLERYTSHKHNSNGNAPGDRPA